MKYTMGSHLPSLLLIKYLTQNRVHVKYTIVLFSNIILMANVY